MEPQNQPIASKPQPVVAEPTKKCKHTPIIIILAILAIGGIGFGGYELWQNIQKDNEIKNLQAEKNNDQKEDTAEENGQLPVDDNIVAENTADYIYVGTWGIKIEIPESLKSFAYVYNNHPINPSLCVSGVNGRGQYDPEFANIKKNIDGMGCLTRYYASALSNEQKQNAIFSVKDYYYLYDSPQAVYSIDEHEQDWEIRSINLIQEMLTKNISTF